MPFVEISACDGTKEEFFACYQPGDEARVFTGGSTLLHRAVANHDPETRDCIANFLLDQGADASAVNEEGDSVLHILFSRRAHDLEKTIALCKRLIDSGADVNQLDTNQKSAIQWMCMMGFSDEKLEPLYDIWFSQPQLHLNTKNRWGVTPIEFVRKFPYRKKLLERMEQYD